MYLHKKFLLLGALAVSVVLILSALATWQFYKLQNLQEARITASAQFDDAAHHILEAKVAFKKQVQHWKNILLRGNDQLDFNTEKAAFFNQEKQVLQALQSAAQMREDSSLAQVEIKALIAEHQRIGERYRAVLQQFDPNDSLSGQKLDEQIRGVDQSLDAALQIKVDALALREREQHKLNDAKSLGDLQKAKMLIALAGLVCVLALMSLMYFILRSVLRQIGGDPQEAVFVANQVSRGNLAVKIRAAEPNSVLDHLQNMVYGLSDVMTDIHHACAALNQIALKVDAAANQLAHNSAEQAQVVSMTSSALEQVAVTVTQNAQYSQKLNLLVNLTPETADLIAEINYASKEQAHALSENSKHLLKLSQRTDCNAQQAQKLSQSAHRLQTQIENLIELINVFKTV